MKELLELAAAFLVVLSPMAVGIWRLFVFPLNSLKDDVKRLRDERNDEVQLRKDQRADYDALEQKHDALVEERETAVNQRRKEMDELRGQIDTKDVDFTERLKQRDIVITDLEGKMESILRLRQSEAIQKEALWQRYQTVNSNYTGLTGQVQSMVESVSILQHDYEMALEKMNNKMEGRYLAMQTQLDEQANLMAGATIKLENAKRFLLQIPGLDEDRVNAILQGQAIWEEVKPAVMNAMRIRDTGQLDPDRLPIELIELKEKTDGPEHVAGADASPIVSSVPGKLDSDQHSDGNPPLG